MVKNMILVVAMALTFFAAPPVRAHGEDPAPECNPCPWVR